MLACLIPVKALYSNRPEHVFSFCHFLFNHTEICGSSVSPMLPTSQAVRGIQWELVSPLPQSWSTGGICLQLGARDVKVLRQDLCPWAHLWEEKYFLMGDIWNFLCHFHNYMCIGSITLSNHCFVLWLLMRWEASLDRWLPGLFFCLLPIPQSVTALNLVKIRYYYAVL